MLIEVNPRISGACGVINESAIQSGLSSQPQLLAETLQGKYPTHINYQNLVNKQKVYWLALFNFSDQPLPDLKDKLCHFKTIHKISQIKEVDYIRPSITPSSLSDAVAFVICKSEDAQLLQQEVDAILELDEKGW